MARIAGIDLPKKKRSEVGLTYIYGIGPATARMILRKAGISFDKRTGDLTDDEVARIRSIITSEIKVEGALRSETQMNIKRLMDIGCYRGIRHRRGLPVRGQRTRTNARTRKGRRKTVAGKKKTAAKTNHPDGRRLRPRGSQQVPGREPERQDGAPGGEEVLRAVYRSYAGGALRQRSSPAPAETPEGGCSGKTDAEPGGRCRQAAQEDPG